MFALVHDTLEQGPKPVVRHVFPGATEDEALGYYEAHRRSDKFLRECDDRGLFDGRVVCRTRKRMLRLTPAQVEALVQGRLSGAMPVRELSQTECPVSFWRFATPVILGNFAGLGAGALARTLFAPGAHPRTRETVSTIAGIAAFWIVAGSAWIIANRRAT